MASNTPILVPMKAQEGITAYVKSAFQSMNAQWNLRSKFETMDLAYQREQDRSKEQQQARHANAYGDKTKFQNITVPVVLPQVEAAVTYQSSVFLQGYPIFGVVASPQYMDEAMQMEAIIEDQSIRGGWVTEFIKMFRDGFKYNLGIVEVSWESCVTAALDTDIGFSSTQAKPREVIWEGNKIRRIDPYNCIFDTRVNPVDIPAKGEFAGFTELMSRVQLKQFIARMPDKMVANITAAFESGLGGGGYQSYYIPQINPNSPTYSRKYGSFNWDAWAGLANADRKIAYKDVYEVTTLYGRIIPSDFGLRVPSPNTPQVWKFVVVNGCTLIYAERQTNAHELLPMLFCQPNEDGLGFQTKSLAENALPFQDITSAMWNSIIAARRRAISDRGIYDPSRISSEHINNENPSAKIPVRPSAYGKNVAECYYPIPFRDDQSGTLMQETGQVLQYADKVSGQNPARQGQFVKGNKTRDEFQTVMGNANGRDQLTSMHLEASIFTPLKHILKTNILQYQGGVKLYKRDVEEVVTIDPVKLRKSMVEFKVTDGLAPADKVLDSSVTQTAMQMIATSPQLNSQYNVGPLFSYFIKTQGGKISSFEKSPEQLAYEQALQSWQQVTLEMAKAGVKEFPPQPLPEQFGYQPAGSGGSLSAQPEVQTRVNNITNNIATNEGAA